MPERLSISAVVLAKNEAHNLPRCLAPLRALCAEVIVVDTGSTDATVAVATELGVRVLELAWQGYGPTKNAANAAASYDWILSVDADEVVTQRLATSIRATDRTRASVAFRIRRRPFFVGKPQYFGPWNPDRKVRLFHRQTAHWTPHAVHERLATAPGVRIVNLSGNLNHHTAPDPAAFADRQRRYARLWAQEQFQAGRKYTFYLRYAKPWVKFFHGYVLKLGFLDGASGYRVARAFAEERRLRAEFLRDFYRQGRTLVP